MCYTPSAALLHNLVLVSDQKQQVKSVGRRYPLKRPRITQTYSMFSNNFFHRRKYVLTTMILKNQEQQGRF